MSDSRVEKLAASFGPMGQAGDIAASRIQGLERAGLLVIDPADPAVIERAAEAMYGGTRWKEMYRHLVRAVLVALGGDRPGPTKPRGPYLPVGDLGDVPDGDEWVDEGDQR